MVTPVSLPFRGLACSVGSTLLACGAREGPSKSVTRRTLTAGDVGAEGLCSLCLLSHAVPSRHDPSIS